MTNEMFETAENYIVFLKGEEAAYSDLVLIVDTPELKTLCERKAKNRRLLWETVALIHSQTDKIGESM